MRNLIFLSVFSIFLSLTSCKRLIYLYHGVHSPRLETPITIEKFCEKKNLEIGELLMMSYDSMITCYRFDLNQTYIFDSSGYRINFNSSFNNPSCGGNVIKVIEGLSRTTYYPRDSIYTLDKEKVKWVYLSNEKPFQKNLNGTNNYTIVCYWNMFTGAPNHRKRIAELKKIISNNKDISVQLIFVNQDFRDGYNIILDAQID
ncbi:MAG TPA: hypothetical protein PL185_08160 [Flavobacteriales bacterium]|nr:hypothetical protein [Flavobacteriales bacterium]HPH82535.1 hypothetical protein [Flavobacteriales bacterium]